MKAQNRNGKPRIEGFQVVENECIWMKAGVVNFRLCDNAYDCNTCPFDLGLRKAMGLGPGADTPTEAPRWVEHLKRNYDGASRPCRHALTGRIDAPKICTNNYECYHCQFDQMLDDMDLAEIGDMPRYRLAAGFRVADGYYYHLGHTWARFEHGGRVRIGFDDFIARLFGAQQTLSLPPLGAKLQQGQIGMTFDRAGRAAAVLAPVTGRVLAVNRGALAHPEIAHEDPYMEGWLCVLEPDMPKRNLKGLYYGRESRRWMEMESERLMQLMGPEYEKLAATGAQLLGDIYGQFPKLSWDELAQEFLRTGRVSPEIPL